MRRGHWLIVGYCAYLLLPVYWLVNMALRSNRDIVGGLEIFPGRPTLANFAEIVTNPVWYEGFANSLTYVGMNTVISLFVALPAALAVSVLASSSSTQLNMKQKNTVTPMPPRMAGRNILRKK